MSVRYEVHCNGRRVCLAGLDGDGVLSVAVTYVKHAESDGHFSFHVGGLGRFDGSIDRQQHANWATVEVGTGDEIAIRILPPGECDDPVGMMRNPQATRDDPEFGTMSRYSSAWLVDVPLPSPPIETARVRIRAGEAGPTDVQRANVRELVERFPALWQEIAVALVKCHREIETVEQLETRIEPRVGVELTKYESDSVGLSFRFAEDSPRRGYHITLRNWEVVEVSAAD